MSDDSLLSGAELDLQEVDRAFANTERAARAMAPAFRKLRRPMIVDQKEHAKSEAGPDGAWPPRSLATERRRLARNRRVRQTKAMKTISPRPSKRKSTPRQLLGRLPMIFEMAVTALSIKMTSRASWSGAHQYGAKVGHNRSTTLPKRVYYYLSDKLLDTAKGVFAEHVLKDWRKR